MDDLDKMVDILGALIRLRGRYNEGQQRSFYKTVTLKIKYADFTLITRSKTAENFVNTYEKLFELGKELLLQVDDLQDKKVRLLGLTLKNPTMSKPCCPSTGFNYRSILRIGNN